jgi:hypothetical protein
MLAGNQSFLVSQLKAQTIQKGFLDIMMGDMCRDQMTEVM